MFAVRVLGLKWANYQIKMAGLCWVKILAAPKYDWSISFPSPPAPIKFTLHLIWLDFPFKINAFLLKFIAHCYHHQDDNHNTSAYINRSSHHKIPTHPISCPTSAQPAIKFILNPILFKLPFCDKHRVCDRQKHAKSLFALLIKTFQNGKKNIVKGEKNHIWKNIVDFFFIKKKFTSGEKTSL